MKQFASDRKLLYTIRNDVDLCHSLFSVSLSVILVHFASVFCPSQPLIQLIIFLLSMALSVIICGWRARWNAMQASFLGGVFTISLFYAFTTNSLYLLLFTRYLIILAVFHYGEFLVTALTNRSDLNFSSYLLDHSLAYWTAALMSWTEFIVEIYLLPKIKIKTISSLGILMIIFGEFLRKIAMFHAKGGFTHIVAIEKRPKHKLITTGIYGIVRHPGYLGWLIWCIGTQVVLCNPFSFIIYSLIGWNFFNERIYWEERYLTCFFGAQYIQYRKEVPLGIPFIKGFET